MLVQDLDDGVSRERREGADAHHRVPGAGLGLAAGMRALQSHVRAYAQGSARAVHPCRKDGDIPRLTGVQCRLERRGVVSGAISLGAVVLDVHPSRVRRHGGGVAGGDRCGGQGDTAHGDGRSEDGTSGIRTGHVVPPGLLEDRQPVSTPS